ncbi:hypothetical protein D9757_015260 [Collybiopsis confluens]|uniref:Ubiquitin-like protease family profile domain-containing protein n=1 Tax=Collybiopsis confluens TaxID=2823264 RepID=A0A8H5C6H1_9AGAR|nr:hypothetical protein D9757_015260 [Collybiopsis confluens]
MPALPTYVIEAHGVEQHAIDLANLDVDHTQLAHEITVLGEEFRTNQSMLSLPFLSSATPSDLVLFVDAIFPATSLCLTNNPCHEFLRQTQRLGNFRARLQNVTSSSSYSNVSPCSGHQTVDHSLSICVTQIFFNLRCLNLVVAQRILQLETDLFNTMIPAPSHCKALLSSMISQVSLSSPSLPFLAPKNIQRLDEGQWLDDEIVNYFVGKWCGAGYPAQSRKVLGLSSFFASKVLFRDAQCTSAKLFLKEEDLLTAVRWCRMAERQSRQTDWDCLFLPINEANVHWYCASIDFKKKRIVIYDSLREHYIVNRPKPVELQKNTGLMLILMRLAELFGEQRGYEVQLRNKTNTEWIFDPHAKVPFQPNGFDCGMHTLWHLRHILRFSTVHSECNSPDLSLSRGMTVHRLRLALELLDDSTALV